MASAFGAGIALYFALPREPAVTTVPIVLLPAIAAVFLTRRRPAMLVSAGLILVFAMGFSLAQIRARVVEAPVLRAELERVVVEGEVMEIELQPTGQRVTLTRLKIGDLAPALTPSRIRLRVVVDQPELSAGQRVAGLADLSPPQGPAAPGSYDFRRDAYFQRLGAIGFSYGRMRILSPRLEQSGPGRLWDGVMHGISDLRRAIALRIVEQLPERPGALAVALVVGDQRAIAKADVEAMRDSGLAHILSISGLHIGLAAGLVFFSVRAVLALIPPLALAQPIKKWAAGAAILSAFFYAILAGWTTPTQRAFIMGGLVFAAIMIDRSPISLRLVAVAAMLTLVMRPEALMGASFQMSFAAVFMLIVAFDGLGPWLSEKRKAIATGEIMPAVPGWVGLAGLWLFATMLSSLVAGFATLPFVVLHFDRVAVYGAIANALAVPLTAFWIMPAAALVLLSMPFGLEAWPLMALGAGCDLLLWIAATVASWPGSSLLVPAPPAWALPIAALGILAIGLVPGWWRLAGILPILAGLGAGYLAATPSLLVAHNGDLVGFRAPDGELILSRSRGAEIARETWLRREARNWAGDIDRLRAGTGWLDCMVDHCRWRGGVELSVVLDGDLRSSAPCRSAALVIVARGRDLAGCGHVTRVMDQDDLAATGAIALYTQGDDITFETGTEATGLRPWTVPGRPQVAVFQ